MSKSPLLAFSCSRSLSALPAGRPAHIVLPSEYSCVAVRLIAYGRQCHGVDGRKLSPHVWWLGNVLRAVEHEDEAGDVRHLSDLVQEICAYIIELRVWLCIAACWGRSWDG
jgi:hypothetical protein